MSISGRMENASKLTKIIMKDLIFEQNPWILISCDVAIENCSLRKMDFISHLDHGSRKMNIYLSNTEIGQSVFEKVGNLTIVKCQFGMDGTENHGENQIVLNATEARISESFFANQSVPSSLFKIINDAVLEIEHSNFTNNAVEYGIFAVTQSKLQIEHCWFMHNKGFHNSSCIHARENSHIDIYYGIFRENSGYYGGVLYAENQVSVSINNTTFDRNSAKVQGGALFLTANSSLRSGDSYYINNSAINEDALETPGSDKTVQFTGHTDYYSKLSEEMTKKLQKNVGARIPIKDPETTKNPQRKTNIRYSQQGTNAKSGHPYNGSTEMTDDPHANNDQWMYNNRTEVNNAKEELQFDGGAILMGDGVTALFINDRFIENKAQNYAGAVFAEDFVNHTYTGCTFSKNVANQNCAGALYSVNQGSLRLKECKFQANSAGDSAGALLIASSDAEIDDSSFTENIALKAAGAIWNLNGAKLVAKNTNFTGNYLTRKVSTGGGLVTFRKSKSWLDNIVFHNNSAQQQAGGIAVVFYSAVSISNSIVDGNSAGLAGGLLLSEFCWANITGTKFRHNSAKNMGSSIVFVTKVHLTIMHSSISQSIPLGSSVIYGDGSVFLNMAFTNISQNRINGDKALFTLINQARAKMHHSNITQNSGGNSKVLVAQMSGILMTSCKFINNTSGGSGAVIITADSHGVIYDSEFTNNSATDSGSQGGAIYIKGQKSSSLNVQRTLFKRNSASVQGGAIQAMYGVVLTAKQCNFIENFGVLYGGAIRANTDVHVSLISCNFSGNSAVNGGALAWEDKVNGCVDSCLLNNNKATKKGGALYVAAKDTSTRISRTSFNSNSAPKGNDLEYAYLDNSNHTTRTFEASFWMNGRWLFSNNSDFLIDAEENNTIRVEHNYPGTVTFMESPYAAGKKIYLHLSGVKIARKLFVLWKNIQNIYLFTDIFACP